MGVHVDVHAGEWVMLWVAAMYLHALLSMADTVCLACMHAEAVRGVHEQCMLGRSVWYVWCMMYGLFKLCCEILLLLNIVDMDRWKTVE